MNTHLIIAPILIPLLAMAVGLLLRQWPRIQAWWSLGMMTTSLAMSGLLLSVVWQGGVPLVFQSGGWAAPFGIVFVADLLAAVLVVMSQAVLTLGFVYALGAKDKVVGYSTFYPLFLALAVGLTGAFLTGDLFNLFVFTELVVIAGTVLTASSDNRSGAEAAYKYFYMSLLAATFLLLACGTLYVSYGTLNMADLAQRIAADGNAPLLPIAIALLLATFMIKSAVFPMHFWQPDFHAAAPTAVSAMLSSVVVKLGVYGFLRMTTLLFVEQAAGIQTLLVGLGVIGGLFGGFSAIGTHDIKRMLAYSTVAQVGFILVGIGWGTPLSIAAALVFTVNHSLIKAAMLMLAGALASRTVVKATAFQLVTGLGRQAPAIGVLFFVGALALSGLPPTNGFVSKFLIFNSGLEATQFTVLLFLALSSVTTLIYTARAFQRIWWQLPERELDMKPKGDKLIAPAILVGLVLLMGVWAAPIVDVAQLTTQQMMEISPYVDAVWEAGR